MKLAFNSSVVSTAADFEHAIAQIRDVELLDANGIVLRVHAHLWQSLLLDLDSLDTVLHRQREAVAARAPGVDVYALADGHSFAESQSLHCAYHPPRLLFSGQSRGVLFQSINPSIVAAIRQQDLEKVLQQSWARCVIGANGNFHFQLPSGAHANQFLRLAEAFVDIQVIDRIAYWFALDIAVGLQPLVENQEQPIALVVDHSSMLVLGARIQRLVDRRIDLFTLPNYPSDFDARLATFQMLDRIAESHSQLFVLIGVASTGQLSGVISKWHEETKKCAVSTTILFTIQEIKDQQTLCNLNVPDYVHYGPSMNCKFCESGSSKVVIQSSSYMISHLPSESLPLSPQFFNAQKPFLEKWGDVEGVLRVHYDDPNESTARHHAFYVDVGTLLNQQLFVEEMIEGILEYARDVDTVAIPDHPTARRIGDILATKLNVPLVVIENSLLQGTRVDHSLQASKTLLVVDDVFITGSRLDTINRFLRERGATQAPKLESVRFYTPLATPLSYKSHKARKRGLTSHHGWSSDLAHGYIFPLPDWHSQESCPWCQEQRFLSRIAQAAGSFDDILSERLAELGLRLPGLTSNAFFVTNPANQLPGIGAESALISEGASPLQMLFVCASGIQQLRHFEDGKSLNSNAFPVQTFLAERVFSQNYSERLIWLGMLRTLKGPELELDLKSYLREKALDKADLQREIYHAEFAIAWLAGKLGPIATSDAVKEFFEALNIPWEALQKTGYVSD